MRARLVSLASSATLHVLLLAIVLTLHDVAAISPALIATPASRTVTVVVVPPEDATFPGLKPAEPVREPSAFERKYSTLAIRDAIFDLDAIAKRARVLFPFLSPGVALELFRLRPDDDLQLFQYAAASGQDPSHPAAPLTLEPAALQALVDRTWSRRERWKAIQPILRLADTHDANGGDMPRLLRAYAEQNMGQYYEDYNSVSRNQRLWAELSLAADHVSFIGYVRRYAAEHPSTNATTELLFLLDKIAEGNRNILNTLLSTDPRAYLSETQTADPRAYALAVDLQKYYREILRTRGLRSPDDVTATYEAARVEILDGILRTTPAGYRANDARFLIGAIRWRAGHVQAALTSWCPMTADDTDAYVDTYRQILSVLQPADGPRICEASRLSIAAEREIDRVFERDAKQSWDFQFDRLHKFGYRFDSF
ncbi:MAG TPA: hypothetical protein VG871_17035 [Vicinamibacterales bacterium]|nr:hypothetical protein [Vicinamibacterales bacterium]